MTEDNFFGHFTKNDFYCLQTNYNNIIFPTFWTIYYNELLVIFFIIYSSKLNTGNNNKITNALNKNYNLNVFISGVTNTLNNNYNLNVFISGACTQVCRKICKLYKKYL